MSVSKPEDELRQVVRTRIEQGLLPCEFLTKFLAGPGELQACAVCDEIIGRDDLEFEYAWKESNLRFHRLCHKVWQLECERAASLARTDKER